MTKLETFSSMLKKSAHKIDNVKVVLKTDRGLFARMAVIAQTRMLDMKEVLQYELGPLLWSLTTGDGSFAKTQKSKVPDVVEKIRSSSDDAIPPHTSVMLDAMAMLQSLVHLAATFGGVSEQVFSMVKVHLQNPGSRVDFVMDQYRKQSIKAGERYKRSNVQVSVRVRVISPSERTPTQWKKFLANWDNKVDVLRFLVAEWLSSRIRFRCFSWQ